MAQGQYGSRPILLQAFSWPIAIKKQSRLKMVQKSESRDLEKVIVRLPDGMRDRIKEAATDNNRSMNAEIVAILQEHYDPERAAEKDKVSIEVQSTIARLLASVEALQKTMAEGEFVRKEDLHKLPEELLRKRVLLTAQEKPDNT